MVLNMEDFHVKTRMLSMKCPTWLEKSFKQREMAAASAVVAATVAKKEFAMQDPAK
jgi:hypothetical protein